MVARCYFQKWQVPYPGLNPFAIIANVAKGSLRPTLDENIPSSFSSLIALCWDQDPENRPSCTVILEKLAEIKQDYDNNKEHWEQIKKEKEAFESLCT